MSEGRLRKHTVCGILMHSSLVVTTQGLPLGIAAFKFWTRKKFKGTQALRGKINPTRVPIEQKESQRWLDNLEQSSALLEVPQRCVHVGDRESDIYSRCDGHSCARRYAAQRARWHRLETGELADLLADDAQPNRARCQTGTCLYRNRLGGYLARASDAPPGNAVVWRGMTRMTDIAIGACIGAKLMGN